ncbi:MAG: hypothetical protein AABY41_04320, partial [Nitrospirota bacterium]
RCWRENLCRVLWRLMTRKQRRNNYASADPVVAANFSLRVMPVQLKTQAKACGYGLVEVGFSAL